MPKPHADDGLHAHLNERRPTKRAIEPGLAFRMPIESGHLVGLFTHRDEEMGELVWIAEPTFSTPPSTEDVAAIRAWRWPAFFPLGPAIRRRLAEPVGYVPIPPSLSRFPTMRSGASRIGWIAITKHDGRDVNPGPTHDRSMPVYQLVNHTSLREKVEGGWRPEDDW